MQVYDDLLQRNIRKITTLHDTQGLDSPVQIADLNDVKIKWDTWRRELPNVDPYYAVKCNGDRAVLEQLSRLGCSFDCASQAEIQSVIDIGADPSKIIYANTVKAPSMLRFAVRHDVTLMTFDNEDELYKIKEIFPSALLILRIKSAIDENATFNLNEKCGCSTKNAKDLLATAKRLNLTVSGISFHIGSCANDPSVFNAAIRDARQVHDIGVNLGFKMHVLDIGGGFPGHYKSFNLFKEMARVIKDALKMYFADEESLRVIAEPGRFFVESAFTLAVKVIGRVIEKQSITNTGEADQHEFSNKYDANVIAPNQVGQKYTYYLNDGFFGHLSYFFFQNDKLEFVPVQDLSKRRQNTSRLWGPTCANKDLIQDDVILPELHVGDWLYLKDAGAYWSSTSSSFNGMPAPLNYYMHQLKQ